MLTRRGSYPSETVKPKALAQTLKDASLTVDELIELLRRKREAAVREYTVILDPDEEEGGYTATVPSLPGLVTQGETIEDCLARVRELLPAFLEDLAASGEPIPEEREHPQAVVVKVAA